MEASATQNGVVHDSLQNVAPLDGRLHLPNRLRASSSSLLPTQTAQILLSRFFLCQILSLLENELGMDASALKEEANATRIVPVNLRM